MKAIRTGRAALKKWGGYLTVFGVGLLLANISNEGWALRTPPTKHKGVSVKALGVSAG